MPGNRRLLGMLACSAFVLGASHAFAQNLSAGGLHPAVQPNDTPKAKPELPPAIPGARSDSEAAPADRAPSDMRPTEALFDAINRGDIAAARDALNRGADLRGRNVLGMTPLDLSVDLGRNDISFLLLSMRGSSGDVAPPPIASATVPPRSPVREVRETRRKDAPAPRIVAAPPQQPALFANNGGAPVPQAGFLGFGTARSN